MIMNSLSQVIKALKSQIDIPAKIRQEQNGEEYKKNNENPTVTGKPQGMSCVVEFFQLLLWASSWESRLSFEEPPIRCAEL